MLSLEEARERLSQSIAPLPVESVPLLEALGRCCAAPLRARVDLPPFDNSAMDGYALRSDDVKSASQTNPVCLDLLGRIGAGKPSTTQVAPGTCLRLFTGSVLPEGADAVVMQEEVTVENGKIRFVESVKPFENVRLFGEDIRAGSELIRAGDRVTATRLALLGATGQAEIPVHKLPRIALLATGDELLEPGQPLSPGKIYESNRALLAGLLKPMIPQPAICPLVPDDLAKTSAALESAFARHDAVITTGGVSVGEFDFVKEAFIRLGGVIDHWKVAIRPGKPFVFGRLGAKLLFGLPGNPVSALVTFLVLVRPALMKMAGARHVELPRVSGELLDPILNPGDRRHFVRCRWDAGKLRVSGRQASHLLGALSSANCLVDAPPASRFEPGTVLAAQLWDLPEN